MIFTDGYANALRSFPRAIDKKLIFFLDGGSYIMTAIRGGSGSFPLLSAGSQEGETSTENNG